MNDIWTLPDAKSFQTFLNTTFPEMIEDVSVDSTLKLLENQSIVSNFLREQSPYRGLLLYHGLGSGKSAASISIAEGYIDRDVVVMLPASLSMNYKHELKHFQTKNKYTLIHYNSSNVIQTILKKLLPLKTYSKLIHEAKHRDEEKEPIKLNKRTISKKERVQGKELNSLLDKLYDPKGKIDNPFSNKTIIIDEVHNLMSMLVGSGANGVLLYEMMMNASNMRMVCLSGTPAINSVFELAMLFNLIRGYMKLFTFTVDTIKDVKDVENALRRTKIINRIYIDGKKNEIRLTRYPLHFSASATEEHGKVKRDEEHTQNESEFIQYCTELLEEKGSAIVDVSTQQIPLFQDILQSSADYTFKKRTSLKHTEKVRKSFLNTFVKEASLKNPDLFKKRILGLVSFYSGADKSVFPELVQHKVQNSIMSNFQCKQYAMDRQIERVLEKRNASQKAQINSTIGDKSSPVSYFRVLSRQSSLYSFPPIAKDGSPMKRPRKKEIIAEYRVSHDKEQDDVSIKDMNLFVKKEMLKRLRFVIKNISKWNVRPFNMRQVLEDFSKDQQLDQEKFFDRIQHNLGDVDIDTIGIEEYHSLYMDFIKLTKLKDILSVQQMKSLRTLLQIIQYPLEICSPKFSRILENMNASPGLIFAYSQFRTAEGIEMFKQTLLHFGYKEYKPVVSTGTEEKGEKMHRIPIGNICRFRKTPNDDKNWVTGRVIHVEDDVYTIEEWTSKETTQTKDAFQATFSLWTGTESKDKKALASVQKVFNSSKNKYGQRIMVLLATESGAEGISLKNVRQVHVFEPFWNEVRIEQVIGRARRVNSHMALLAEQRNVHVFNYVSVLSKQQLSGKWATTQWMQKQFSNIELKQPDESVDDVRALNDDVITQRTKKKLYSLSDEMSKSDKSFTSDEILMKIAAKKNQVIQEFLTAMKEAAVDCSLHKVANMKNDIDVNCVKNIIQEGDYTYEPEVTLQSEDKYQNVRKTTKKDFDSVVQTPFFRVLVPLRSEEEKIENIEDEREVFDYYTFKGMLPVSAQIPYTKYEVGRYTSVGGVHITDSSQKEKWIMLEKILKERKYIEQKKNNESSEIAEIRNEFIKRWDEYRNKMNTTSVEEIIKMRLAQLK